MGRKRVALIQYATPDLVPANLRVVAAIDYSGGLPPANLKEVSSYWYNPGDAIPDRYEEVGAVTYAIGAATPPNLPVLAAMEPDLSVIDPATMYWQRVLSTRPGNLIGYWPLWEVSGTKSLDLSGSEHHGAYTGVDLGQAGIGDGWSSPYFDGASDYCNIYSAALAAAFNGAEGTLMIWAKVANAGVWTDNSDHHLCRLRVDANNTIDVWKWGGDNNLYWDHTGSGTLRRVNAALTPTDWFLMTLTWGASGVRAFYRGSQQGATQGTPGAWVGTPGAALIAAQTATPAGPWLGNLAHCALWTVALTPAEIAELAVV